MNLAIIGLLRNLGCVSRNFSCFSILGLTFSAFKKGDGVWNWLASTRWICKDYGMVDESMDKEQLALEPQPWEFRSKPAWQRLIVMIGGVTVNFILGFLLFAMVLFVWGDKYLDNDKVVHGLTPSLLATQMGFEPGDRVIQVGDQPLQEFNPGKVITALLFHNQQDVKVLRNGAEVDLVIPDSLIVKLPSQRTSPLFLYQEYLLLLVN